MSSMAANFWPHSELLPHGEHQVRSRRVARHRSGQRMENEEPTRRRNGDVSLLATEVCYAGLAMEPVPSDTRGPPPLSRWHEGRSYAEF